MKRKRSAFTFIEWFFDSIFPALFIFMLIFALGSVVVGIYLMAVVGMDIHQNGLKSVVETIWNGVK
ncbi:TPA: DUF7248 family protein [Escherichia coli]